MPIYRWAVRLLSEAAKMGGPRVGRCRRHTTIGILITVDTATHDATLTHPTGVHLKSNVPFGIDSFVLYVPALFLVEEVAFRGALDSDVRHPGGGGRLASAIFVSVLWGLWHHSIVPQATIVQLLVTQVAIGQFFSLFWRRSGNLMVHGTAHALNDAVRNALLGIPQGSGFAVRFFPVAAQRRVVFFKMRIG